ncbi:hypothetical protein HYH03_004120 [Edaphochlamys debaryana]|uniref:Serine aminopeptidase S33 domain-containing protein n=1 Tax=Edaphochlamys debaryana TaxID=47281 RepID=A0A835YHQ6_9CHLO|nr:hypothetical protein HYH03_004120 [Edaphochlamys debaryana]|eukprot:KAG2497854.1 hypothetical protein HYH03_004120 [Edaphochlamys debaryana]
MAVALRGALEVLMSVLTYPTRHSDEEPVITCHDTASNGRFLAAMPSLRAFRPTWWAVGPYAQTVLNSSRAIKNALPEEREYVPMADGVEVALDWKVLDPDLSPEAPLVLVCHGLGGSSSSPSCAGVTEALAREGWRAVVYVRRGHGGTSLLPPSWQTAVDAAEDATRAGEALVKAFPCHVDMDDLRQVVHHLSHRFPSAPKLLVGLSAGGNLAVRYQGDCPGESPFIAAVSISNGHELTQLMSSLRRRPLMDAMLVTFIKGIMYDRMHEVEHLLERANIHVHWPRLTWLWSTRPFEEHLTSRVWGYTSVDEYYAKQGCFKSLQHVQVPLLSLASADDPMIDPQLIRYAQEAARANPHVLSVATVRGGHLGWLEGNHAVCWMHKVIVQYLREVLAQAQSGSAVGQ